MPEPVKEKKAYVATIQVLIDAADYRQACDVLHGALTELDSENGILDWGYLRIGGQYLYPQETLVEEGYREGDFLNW
jgi:hypothetical protein